MIKIVVLLFCLVCFQVLKSQSPLNKSLGNCVSLKTENQELFIETDFGKARVIVYTPSVIRIRVEKNEFLKQNSYAVFSVPEKCSFKVTETDIEYAVQTDSVMLKINKKPVRFSFYTKEGKLINQDDAAFGTSWLGDEVCTYKKLLDGERFVGLGEHTGNLDRRGETYINFNTDNPGYNEGSKSLYASIPFYIGLHNGLCYGIFLDNSSRTTFNFGAGNNRFASFTADCGEMDYYFIYRSDVKGLIESYTGLTGRMPMPPLWSLGYQQCRYSYFPDADLLSTALKFRERNIPADMIYLDIHYMDHFKLFTWDSQRFPNPEQTIRQLKQEGFHTAVIIDPGVKVEQGYATYQDGLKNDIFVKYPDGENYQGQVWPGWCNFPDFTMPKAREWWGKWVSIYANQGVTGFWNDMNEIAAWGQDVPKLLEFNWEGKKTSYSEAKNVYGMQMARSTYEGAKKSLDNKRPFVLTRSGYAGLQRYTAIWTGDNQSYDGHMMLGVRLLSSMGLSGISFCGMDIGGFGGNPTQELYTRWMEIGAFSPMFRGHTAIYTPRTEPWAMGEIAEDVARRYIGFRYQLMPYLYSSFFESTQNGLPIVRSLAIDYNSNPEIFNTEYQQQFLFGQSILVAPAQSKQSITKVYLPQGKWYDLFTDKLYSGNEPLFIESPIEKLPLFVKGGAIIPMQKLIETTALNPGDTLFIHVFSGDSKSSFVYYEDDGNSYDYQQGKYYKRTISYNPVDREINFSEKNGSNPSCFTVVTLVFHGFIKDELKNMSVLKSKLKVESSKIRLFKSNFKFADYGPDDTREVLVTSFSNNDQSISLKW
jgi:alpha-glucosidase